MLRATKHINQEDHIMVSLTIKLHGLWIPLKSGSNVLAVGAPSQIADRECQLNTAEGPMVFCSICIRLDGRVY